MMERTLNLIRGCVRIKAVGAFPTGLLNAMSQAGVQFWRVDPVDECTLSFTARLVDVKKAQALAARSGCSLETIKGRGVPVMARRLKRRKTLIASALICALTLFASSLFVWDIEVTGNEQVSKGQIMRALEECGVEIGSFWPAYENELIKNEMLIKIPELSWLTVNVSHSRAEVLVRERIARPGLVDNDEPVNVVARRTGIIRKMSVLQGFPLVGTGKAVLEGETMVSGFMGSGLTGGRFVHAMAEIEALTYYEMTASAPLLELRKEYTGREKSRWALLVAKSRINIFSGSRNVDGEYDKIIDVYPFAEEGLFTLPITLVRERCAEYELIPELRSVDEVATSLSETLYAALEVRLHGYGEVQSSTVSVSERDGLVTVTLRAECVENIALEMPLKQYEGEITE